MRKGVWVGVVLLTLGLALGQRAYVGNAGNSTVLVLDLAQPRVVASWGTYSQPWSVAYGGGRVYVAEYVGRPDAPQPAGRVVELDREGKAQRFLLGAHYPMGVAYGGGRAYVASSAVDWTGAVRGTPEILVYGSQGQNPVARFPFPGDRFGYPQTLLWQAKGLYVATTWGLLLLLDPEKGEVKGAFSLPARLNPIRGLAGDGQGGLYLTGHKDGLGRVVHRPASLLEPGEGVKDLSDQARVVAEGLPDPWGVVRVGEVLYVVTSTDATGTGPGGLWRVEPATGKAQRLLTLPTRYTLGLAVEE
ncbi:hypothetical protein [Thermus sp.]|uniref:YncE family protein n=1 Tax=Thermus sp. TaxID=275 RepID=UPI0025DF751C|nr:hypothetical protein [Thermus sp.]MCS6868177.1 hypothetical protein [Thermus sp.]MDW8358927.1 hypothetical protein [Thermus sp.]